MTGPVAAHVEEEAQLRWNPTRGTAAEKRQNMTATTPSQPASDPGRNVTAPSVEFSLDDKLPGKTVAESAGIIVPDNAPGGKAQRFDSSAYTPDGGRDHSRTGGESTSDLWTADADYEGYDPEEYWQH